MGWSGPGGPWSFGLRPHWTSLTIPPPHLLLFSSAGQLADRSTDEDELAHPKREADDYIPIHPNSILIGPPPALARVLMECTPRIGCKIGRYGGVFTQDFSFEVKIGA